MRREFIMIVAWSLAICFGPAGQSAAAAQDLADAYRSDANRLIEAALADSAAYDRLTELVDGFGHRHSGSVSLERALDWILEEMKADGLDNVHGDGVFVPHWLSGEEALELVADLGACGGLAPGKTQTKAAVDEAKFEGVDELRVEEAALFEVVLGRRGFFEYGVVVSDDLAEHDLVRRAEGQG